MLCMSIFHTQTHLLYLQRCAVGNSEVGLKSFHSGIKSLRATLPAEIFIWGFKFLKGSLRDVFISRSALKG
jgi:hypothetical protein